LAIGLLMAVAQAARDVARLNKLSNTDWLTSSEVVVELAASPALRPSAALLPRRKRAFSRNRSFTGNSCKLATRVVNGENVHGATSSRCAVATFPPRQSSLRYISAW
jgi:hypothetical protein